MKALGSQPFEEGADRLIEQNHAAEEARGDTLRKMRRGISCRQSQERRFDEDRCQHGRCRHAEKQMVSHGRNDGREESCPPSVFVCSDEREEVDRQPDHSASGDEVAQLRQGDVAQNEQRCDEVGFGLVVTERVEFDACSLHDSIILLV